MVTAIQMGALLPCVAAKGKVLKYEVSQWLLCGQDRNLYPRMGL
jgi:hypothetical protein